MMSDQAKEALDRKIRLFGGNLEFAIASERAPRLTDLHGNETEFRLLRTDMKNGQVFYWAVSDDGRKAKQFEVQNPQSGTEDLQRKAEAQAWAIDHHGVPVSQEDIFYFRKGDQVLVNEDGDSFLAAPDRAPNAELVIAWHPAAVEMELDTWGKMGVECVTTTVEELESKGGIFAKAAHYLRHTQPNRTRERERFQDGETPAEDEEGVKV